MPVGETAAASSARRRRCALLTPRRFDLEDELARQDLDCVGGQSRANGIDGGVQRRPEIGRKPIMQRERIALVLDENARARFASAPPACASIPRSSEPRAARGSAPGAGRSSAPWPPMAASRSGEKIRSMSLSRRPLTSASAPPVKILRAAQASAAARRHPDLLRRRRDIEDGAVDVEQDRAFAQVGREPRFCDFHSKIGDVFLAPHVHIPIID